MDLAIQKAEEFGIGMVVARNSNHYGIAGYYSMMAADKGFVGMSFTNTSPVAVPTRASKGALGTNPISIAGPTSRGDPVVVDMATTNVPFGRTEVAYRKGEQVPKGWGVDGDGLDCRF
jgi:LDH2 family malate/lactate/ureidoglycolate dehydrogenase